MNISVNKVPGQEVSPPIMLWQGWRRQPFCSQQRHLHGMEEIFIIIFVALFFMVLFYGYVVGGRLWL